MLNSIICNIFITFLENDFFPSRWFIHEKRNNCLPEGSIVCYFRTVKIVEVLFLCSFLEFFTIIYLNFIVVFLSLDLSMIALWSSFVIKGASLARTYFLFIGTCLSKIQNTVSMKFSKFACVKIAFFNVMAKDDIVKFLVVTVCHYFRLLFSESIWQNYRLSY